MVITMKSNLQRTFSAVLTLLLAAASIGCGTETAQTGEIPTDVLSETEAPVTEPAPINNLPAFDLGNYELRVLKQDQDKILWCPNKFAPEEENGDIMNDAYYRRNENVTQKYGFSIKETIIPGEPQSEINRLIAAGDDAYDIVLMYLNKANTSYNGNFLDFYTLPYLDLSKPYWDQALMRDMTVGGKLCLMSGDLIVQSRDDNALLLIYNRPLAEDFNLENLYDTVRTGKWTYDRMYDCIKTVSQDLDDPSVKDENDRMGVLYSGGDVGPSYFASCDVQLFTMKNGTLSFTGDEERVYSVYEKVQKIFSDKELSLDQQTLAASDKISVLANVIDSKLCLFEVMSPGTVQRASFREAKSDFGMLPLPKYDEAQENYRTSISLTAAYIYLPATIGSPDKVAYILEAMSSESGELVDTYFTRCLEGKYSRDENAYEMMRIATDNVIYDMGFMYNFGSFGTAIKNGLMNSATGYSSMVAEYKTAAVSAMEKAVEEFTK